MSANRKKEIEASGVVIADTLSGEDVGVSDLQGLISLDEGRIILCKVPRVLNGGSGKVDLPALQAQLARVKNVGCLGIEALVALRKVGREPDIIFGAKEFAVEAAYHGISSVIVSVDEQIPGLLTRLESEGLKYELIDLTLG
jgi:putative transcriptional regulator